MCLPPVTQHVLLAQASHTPRSPHTSIFYTTHEPRLRGSLRHIITRRIEQSAAGCASFAAACMSFRLHIPRKRARSWFILRDIIKKVEEKVVLSRPMRSTIAGPTRTRGGDDMGAARSARRVERGASARDTEKCYSFCNPVTETAACTSNRK